MALNRLPLSSLRPHACMPSAVDHCSMRVPPQLLLTSPRGTSAGRTVCLSCTPNSQHTDEKWPKMPPPETDSLLAIVQFCSTVCRSPSGYSELVP